ncbi:DUF998 domain-containing protein [Nesterenkonia ebinurensis]|uniref:DUF998 domain-containing protein n=1 Tax=Nesterenkonia ebinurensis TaxID=2608252 RepID=UPI001CC6E469|nr:DUF998 domain-containing protein [Nesterenkonia ebinurensis]
MALFRDGYGCCDGFMPLTSIEDYLLWIGAIGASGFLIVVLIEGWIRPGYSPVRHPVSALALSRRGWIQMANFAVAGIAITVGAIGVLLQGIGLIFALSIMVFGVGLACSAFSMDPSRGYPPGAPAGDPAQPSWNHRLHDLAGAVVFFSLPVVALVAVFALPVWWMKLIAGATVAWLCVAIHFWDKAWENDSPRTGLAQRAFIVPGWLWLASVFSVLAAA